MSTEIQEKKSGAVFNVVMTAGTTRGKSYEVAIVAYFMSVYTAARLTKGHAHLSF